MSYKHLPPSTQWNHILIPDAMQGSVVWFWNKPGHDPFSLQLEIPFETCIAIRDRLSIRFFIALLRFPIQELTGWSVQGYFYPYTQENAAVFDQLIPVQLNHPLRLTLHWQHVTNIIPQGNPPVYQEISGMTSAQEIPKGELQGQPESILNANSDDETPMYSRQIFKTDDQGNVSLSELNPDELRVHFHQMSTDWLSIIQTERQLSTLRKSMEALAQRLTSLNRDLTADENSAADSMDKKDWQDARRWLRDSITNISRYVREYDVGITSNAGNRNKLEAIFNEYVYNKLPFPDLLNIRREYELHRKMIHTLGQSMQNAYANASRDGENRARNLLNRITSKARSRRNKS